MADDKLAEIWKTQKSLTEWLEDINHKDAAAIRREDNDKRERLKVLNKVIGLPFDEPVQFEALELAENTPAVATYIKEHGDELCALRLMPKEDDLPKLRMRGKSISQAYEWFKEQKIDVTKYRADFVPHIENTRWATIFIVNKQGIQGEITRGGHHELTQGFHDTDKPTVFRFDFRQWQMEPYDEETLVYVKGLANFLLVDAKKQLELAEKLGATFVFDYLEGYFETTDSEKYGTWFIDYSPSLGKMYEDFTLNISDISEGLVHGQTGSKGRAEGPVVIVEPDNIENVDFPEGGILVCKVTTPNFVPLMRKAAGIVTDQGGVLSHAAIVARELKVPCIVATGNATQVLQPGQKVVVDADKGVVS